MQNFLLARGVQSNEIKDLVQESFIRLWNNCSKIKEASASSFLFTAAKNLSIDNFRKQQVRLKYIQKNQASVIKEDGQYHLELKEFQVQLETAINSMTEASKEVFMLHRFNEMTYKEIASALDISVKAVEKRMHKALAHLLKEKINVKKR